MHRDGRECQVCSQAPTIWSQAKQNVSRSEFWAGLTHAVLSEMKDFRRETGQVKHNNLLCLNKQIFFPSFIIILKTNVTMMLILSSNITAAWFISVNFEDELDFKKSNSQV